MALFALCLFILTLTCTNFDLVTAGRHAVHWNSSNILLRKEGYTVQVNVNDYLDIYCPHYNSSQRGVAEQYVLYMVSYRGYRTCDPQLGFKRWECNRPHAPHAPIKFSEKFQRYSAFSLGYEFHVGQEYYYICEYIVCFTSPIHTSKSIVTQLRILHTHSSPRPELPEIKSVCLLLNRYRPQSIRLSIIHPSIQLYFSVS
uniref:Ephrin RBD domain-containing protein n=1 Tax=Sinocyclocheilus anshuiensis TaxID=1608454 RepID=A0A671QBZ9_9TELE